MRFAFVLLLSVCAVASAGSPDFNPEFEPSLQLLNNGQLIEAYDSLKGLEEKYSESPDFLFLRAMAKWKMMWLSTYNKSDREEVIGLLDQVDQLCLAKENDVMANFYHAAATGLRAQVAATEGDWWKTAKLGKKMKSTALEIVEQDEEFFPAYSLLGSYNYFADALPGYLKFLRVFVFLPGGDRKEGSKQLVLAYEKGGITEGEAGRTLAIIYTFFEKKATEAVEMCDDLLNRYPDSYDVRLYRGINLYFLKSYDEAINSFDHLRQSLRSYSLKHQSDEEIVPVYKPMEREIRYWTARAKMQQGKSEEAREMLLDLANPPVHQPYWLLRGVYLSLAHLDYQMNNPQRAEGWISKVLQWEDVKESHDKAKKLKKKKSKIDPFDLDFL
jgi:hypothetical protein